MTAPGTVPCPGTTGKPCGNALPAVPGYVFCVVCRRWWVLVAS